MKMTQNIEVVVASQSDFEDIQRLFKKLFDLYPFDQNIEYPYTDSGIQYLQQRIQQQMAFVAKDHGRIVGFLTGDIENALPFKTYRRHGHIHNLFVVEKYRGQGIGKQLVERFIQVCEDNHVHQIMTDSDDIESLRCFYRSLGFRITGVNYEMNTVLPDQKENAKHPR